MSTGRGISATLPTALTFTTPKTLHALFKFIAETGCFHRTFRDLPTIDKEQQKQENTVMEDKGEPKGGVKKSNSKPNPMHPPPRQKLDLKNPTLKHHQCFEFHYVAPQSR